MRNAPWIIAVTLFFLGSTAPSVAQVEATDETEAEESLSDLTIPGEPHELLAGTVGEWRLTFRVWTAPDTEPAESTGTAVGRWILGDRFVETVYEGEVMDRPFEALKIEGFEKASKEYVTTWRVNLDSASICMMRVVAVLRWQPKSSTCVRSHLGTSALCWLPWKRQLIWSSSMKTITVVGWAPKSWQPSLKRHVSR